jgi:hypothetical protein
VGKEGYEWKERGRNNSLRHSEVLEFGAWVVDTWEVESRKSAITGRLETL